MNVDPRLLGLAVALCVGLLIGSERERRNRTKTVQAVAGVRTYAVATLLGATSAIVGGPLLVATTTAAIGALAFTSYLRARPDPDPGMTSELALLLAGLIGALAPSDPALAAALGVSVTVLLAVRTPLHRFVRRVLTAEEWRDGLVLFTASIVILPQLPNRTFGPFDALNPHAIWVLVVMILAIGAFGHVATRIVGARWGMPMSGLISGFASSTATIGALGALAKTSPAVLPAAVAGAVLSTVATVVQMAIVIGVTDFGVLRVMAVPLAAAAGAALLFGSIFTIGHLRHADAASATATPAVNLVGALIFAATLSAVLLASAAIRNWFGEVGLVVASAVAGLADGHAGAISAANLAAQGRIARADAVWPILASLSANTLIKMVVAVVAGGRAFARRVIPGLVAVVAVAWLTAAYTHL